MLEYLLHKEDCYKIELYIAVWDNELEMLYWLYVYVSIGGYINRQLKMGFHSYLSEDLDMTTQRHTNDSDPSEDLSVLAKNWSKRQKRHVLPSGAEGGQRSKDFSGLHVLLHIWGHTSPWKSRGLAERGPRGRGWEWATLGVHPLSWLLSNNRLEEVCSTLTKGTFSSRLLLSNQVKGCSPSVAHSLPLPLGPALLDLSSISNSRGGGGGGRCRNFPCVW